MADNENQNQNQNKLPLNNSARRRELNGGSDRPDTTPTVLDVRGHITEGTHIPYVTLILGDNSVNLNIERAVTFASTVFQATAMAFEDAMACEYFASVLGMDKLQAYQHTLNFQHFREARIEAFNAARQQQQQGG